VIRTGEQYRDSIRDGRRVWIDGERVADVTRHRMFQPLVDIRARIYDMAHEEQFRPVMTYADEHGHTNPIANRLPTTQQDWHDKRRAVETVLDEIGGVVTRVGDETVGEVWSLYDGQDVLNEANPRFAENIRRHVQLVIDRDPFHVSANTDPKGDRSKPMPASSSAAPNMKPQRPMRTRPSPNQPSPTGATLNCPTMLLVSFATSARPT